MTTTKGILFVISAPTGGGKTTITQAVITKISSMLPIAKVITYTTRQPRAHEQNNIDYHFVSEADFLQKKDNLFFLETTLYDGYWYGSPQSLVNDLDTGKSFLLVTDRPGAKIIKECLPEAVLIWIDVPSVAIVAQRLQKRGTETDEAFERRLELASHEIEEERQKHLFTYHVMNSDLGAAVDAVAAIIIDEIAKKFAE